MKIKFDWGTGIVITIVMIVLFVGTLVYIATRQNFDLVEDDYYERGIRYQEQIEKRQNSAKLSAPVQLVQAGENVKIKFPEEFEGKAIIGSIYFYSPVDKSNDFTTEFQSDSKIYRNINISNLKKGRYLVKIDWKTNDKNYYFEESFVIR